MPRCGPSDRHMYNLEKVELMNCVEQWILFTLCYTLHKAKDALHVQGLVVDAQVQAALCLTVGRIGGGCPLLEGLVVDAHCWKDWWWMPRCRLPCASLLDGGDWMDERAGSMRSWRSGAGDGCSSGNCLLVMR